MIVASSYTEVLLCLVARRFRDTGVDPSLLSFSINLNFMDDIKLCEKSSNREGSGSAPVLLIHEGLCRLLTGAIG